MAIGLDHDVLGLDITMDQPEAVGRFEAAHGGDIFLDEIGDLSYTTQAKLLRVLQEKVIEKVGDHKPIPVDVRVITATNKDLLQLIAEGKFREYLYYRINVIPIHLPPLRERREDIPLLTEAFIERARLKTRKPITGISKEALELFLQYHWPGNVRELLNAIEYAFVLCREDNILPDHLPPEIVQRRRPSGVPRAAKKSNSVNKGIDKEMLIRTIRQAGGNKSEAARILGVSRVTMWKWLKQCNLHDSEIMAG